MAFNQPDFETQTGTEYKTAIDESLAYLKGETDDGCVTNGDSHDHSGGDGAQIDHGGLAGLGDDDHTQYIKHSLATAANDFLIASGSGAFVKKTLAETQAILNLWRINDIGVAGTAGFGCGICPPEILPNGFSPMDGYTNPQSDNYGNYQYEEGSIMVWIPKFYYLISTNDVDIKPASYFFDTATANAAGYALHRAFIDGGVEQPGLFLDKYKVSKVAKGTGTVCASIKNGLPLSTESVHNPMYSATPGVGLTACAGNYYYESIKAAHARDGADGAENASSNFFVCSRFIHAALALLSLAHAQASTSTTWCAWYNSTYNYPKGCNNNALRDVDDTSVLYVTDGYNNCGKTGSGSMFAKTTHNGQNCGVADLNGLMWEISLGVTCIAGTKSITGATQANPCVLTVTGHGLSTGAVVMITSVVGMTQLNNKLYTVTYVDANHISLDGTDSTGYTAYSSAGTLTYGTFYAAKQATAMKSFTSGNSGGTDHWGATGVAAMMDAFSPAFKTSGGGALAQRYGSGSNQVLSETVSGANWLLTGLGLPKDANGIDTTGTNESGKDYYYQYIKNELCALSCAYWNDASNAGVWSLHWGGNRSNSSSNVGWRCAAYPL